MPGKSGQDEREEGADCEGRDRVELLSDEGLVWIDRPNDGGREEGNALERSVSFDMVSRDEGELTWMVICTRPSEIEVDSTTGFQSPLPILVQSNGNRSSLSATRSSCTRAMASAFSSGVNQRAYVV